MNFPAGMRAKPDGGGAFGVPAARLSARTAKTARENTARRRSGVFMARGDGVPVGFFQDLCRGLRSSAIGLLNYGGGAMQRIVAHESGVNNYLDGRRQKVPKLGSLNCLPGMNANDVHPFTPAAWLQARCGKAKRRA